MTILDIFPNGFDFTIEGSYLIKLEPAKEMTVSSIVHTKSIESYYERKNDSYSMYNLDNLEGTDLQKKVWEELQRIPFGETISYEELANKVGSKAVRAVASAVGKNPVPIIIPCHRVIRKDGSIGEYSMGGAKVKRALLHLEGVNI